MAQTYTTQFFDVSNGDVTTHNPQSLVPTTDDIRILNAEIQWEGKSTSTRRTKTNTDSLPTGRTKFLNDTAPSYPSISSEDTFIKQTLSITTDGYQVGEVFDPHLNDTPGVELNYNKTWGTYKTGSVNFVMSEANQQINFSLKTVYDDIVRTTDPRATRDVLGESNGVTLSDGSSSNWYSLSGLDPNSEEFYHDISGSGQARFRFRFDWRKKYPDAIHEWRISDGQGTTYRVALADPADPQLEYTHHRVAVVDGTHCLDVVDPSHPDAIPWRRWYHPTHGTYCPRAFGTV